MRFSITAKGFTLLEAIAVTAIIAAMAALAMPALRSYRPALALQAESRQLVADLREAQQRTVTEQASHYLTTAASSSAYQLYRDGSPPTLLKSVAFANGVTVQNVTGPQDATFRYNAYGAVTAAGTIVLSGSNGVTRTVVVRPSGHVTVE